MENTWFKDIPLWIVISIFLVPIVAILLKIFVVDKKIHNQPLSIRRKRLLIIFAVLILLLLIMTCIGGIKIWTDTLALPIQFLITIAILLYAFFHKGKRPTEDDSKDKMKIKIELKHEYATPPKFHQM
ncbi:hypothetical protein FACS1894178_9360 [Bacteroidia bacterium]|nr:hypothetical protein FACS1894178_9360 [Bacteroidia bacterium]